MVDTHICRTAPRNWISGQTGTCIVKPFNTLYVHFDCLNFSLAFKNYCRHTAINYNYNKTNDCCYKVYNTRNNQSNRYKACK